jgi:site-specific recombinase XerD
MRAVFKPSTPAEMYDRALRYARDKRLPPDYPKPRPTCEWPAENITLLEEYCEWLRAGGASPAVIRIIYLPMAGHILGLALKPHPQLDLESDLQRGLDFLKAKRLSAQWTDVCRCAMLKFRRFLSHQRGQIESKVTPYEHKHDTQGLPLWLVNELERFQHVQQRNWREARLEYAIRRFWAVHLHVWRFLCEKCGVKQLADVKRKHLLDYMDERLQAGYAASSINTDVRTFHGFLAFLQEEGCSVPRSLFRIPGLKQPEPLPKFLTDEQVRLLRDEFERRVAQARDFRPRRDALLDRAAFYLLWQSGLRMGEVEELHLEDLDFLGKKLTVRQSKGLKDRTVFMTDTSVQAIREYLAVRGPGPTTHVFLYRNQPLSKDLVPARLKAVGQRVGVKVHPHRLRHTMATQLLNAGCRVTSLQKFLGHKELSTTMVYARVHDQTVAGDYYAAMQKVEKQLDLSGIPENAETPLAENEREQLLKLTKELAKPVLSAKTRLKIVAQLRQLLQGPDVGQIYSPKLPVPVPIEMAFAET